MADTNKYRVVRDLKVTTIIPAGSEIELTEADANGYVQNGDINLIEVAEPEAVSEAAPVQSDPPTPPAADPAPVADPAADGAPAGDGE